MTETPMADAKRLAEQLATNPDHPEFTAEQREALRMIAEAYLALEVFGKLAGLVKKIVVYVGWMIAIYLVVKGHAIDFIKSVVGSKP